jgi:hypothetical protein
MNVKLIIETDSRHPDFKAICKILGQCIKPTSKAETKVDRPEVDVRNKVTITEPAKSFEEAVKPNIKISELGHVDRTLYDKFGEYASARQIKVTLRHIFDALPVNFFTHWQNARYGLDCMLIAKKVEGRKLPVYKTVGFYEKFLCAKANYENR